MKDSISPDYLHISGYGKKLSRYKGLLRVDWIEDEENRSFAVSLTNLKQVIVSGNHTITTGAVSLLLEDGIDMTFLEPSGGLIGYLFPASKGQMLAVWEKQALLDDRTAIQIAKKILSAASMNKILILKDLERNRRLNLYDHISKMLDASYGFDIGNSRDRLMGIEGVVSGEYFRALQSLIPEGFMFRGRFRRPAPDVVNVMMNYGYGILYSFVRNAISMSGLNPYRGVLHASYKNQEALVYDLIEEFRQPVVDRAVFTMLGRKEVSEHDYFMDDGACKIKDAFRKKFAERVLSKLDSTAVYDERKERFARIIQLQAQRLKDAIIEGAEYVPFVYKRR